MRRNKYGEIEAHDDEFVEYLDDLYGQIEVCGYMYYAGELFKNVDPVAFQCEKTNWLSVLEEDFEELDERI